MNGHLAPKRDTPGLKAVAYVDGSGSTNDSPMGWGVVMTTTYPSGMTREEEWSGHEMKGSSQRAEMMAVLSAIWSLKGMPTTIHIYTDAQVITLGWIKWLPGWVKNNWTTYTGKPVANADLWHQMIQAASPHRVFFQWLPGHQKNDNEHAIGNNRADKLARAARWEAEKILASLMENHE